MQLIIACIFQESSNFKKKVKPTSRDCFMPSSFCGNPLVLCAVETITGRVISTQCKNLTTFILNPTVTNIFHFDSL